ncbi:NAD-dependent epimerase/dehydratase family protein [Brevibacillus sp. SYP-B805]|uniref:NAD-dependent epimerase/dehydratase family protein n=1 Tax=Brevibacillus sp. SYP-B805 TaxID=1578199 RepID=UPI0013EBB94F|nr:NAD-dependent epimerase/dehydratase family protein [Brevibacillus sp. SYP-B805]NGQ95721.1 NAD-dependent epimerase/dehydratase family protein [Brevibacillus sp. SYP-B805]
MKFGSVLVTGGAGFVGSQLVKRLLPLADHITIIDDLSTGNRQAIPDSDKITFYQDSVTNEGLLQAVLPEVEWVFHLSCRNLVLSAENLEADFHTNLYGGFLLLNLVKKYCHGLRRMIYTSTASVYGNAPVIPTPESFYQITMPYSASKFSVEHYCQVFIHMYQLPVTILRLSNLYGPGQLTSNPYCGVVSKFFEAIEQGRPMTIYGDGRQSRDFTFIQDALDAILLAARHPHTVGKVYNVGTGKETSILELAAAIAKVTGKQEYPYEFQEKRTVDRVVRRALDARSLQQDIEWTAKVALEDGLRRTYQWLTGTEHERDEEMTDKSE